MEQRWTYYKNQYDQIKGGKTKKERQKDRKRERQKDKKKERQKDRKTK